jgi:hypothetical protein
MRVSDEKPRIVEKGYRSSRGFSLAGGTDGSLDEGGVCLLDPAWDNLWTKSGCYPQPQALRLLAGLDERA